MSTPAPEHDDLPEGLVSPADIGSASRSCLAIIIVLIGIVLLLCVFLLVQTFR
jgi:hypothetical protein